MGVLAFAASNSSQSINQKLVRYACSFLQNIPVEIVDINDYAMPLFSVDLEKDIGHHELAKRFYSKIGESEALVISFAEHNSSYTAAFKNLFDWCSRINVNVYQNKPSIFLSTSPGKRGGANVMETALSSAERYGANVLAHFSLPRFNDNFDREAGAIRDPAMRDALHNVMQQLQNELKPLSTQ